MEKKFRDYLNEEQVYKIYIIKNPAGKYIFSGTVPINALYVKNDGSDLSDGEIKKIAISSTPWMLVKQFDANTRSFDTSDEAKEYADEKGFKIFKIKN